MGSRSLGGMGMGMDWEGRGRMEWGKYDWGIE